jgi:tetratricopeptide (TPR) repeat protein
MVDFFTTWCGPCKRLDATTWKDTAVIAWLGEHTVALKLDAEIEVDLAKQHAIRAYPTLLFVKPDGSELGRLVGYKDAEGFLQAARDLLAGKTPLDTAREAFAEGAQGPSERMQLARELERAGELVEAAEQLLWCWDNGFDSSPGFSAVRVSFLVSQMEALASRYPPLREELAERRERAAAVLLDGGSSREALRQAAKDLAVLDERLLDAPQRSLEVFDRLSGEERAEAREALADQLEELLVRKRRYADALIANRDPVRSVRVQVESIPPAEDHERSEEEQELGLPSMREMRTRWALGKGSRVFEACAGAGRLDEAREIAALLLELDPTGPTCVTLVERAVRAEELALARELVRRGREALAGEELERLERAARALESQAHR